MRPEAGRLRTQLLRWLLVPLLALLAVDAAVSVWVAQRVAQSAQDKALREIAHELGLMVRLEPAGTLALELPEAARRVLLEDPEDRVSFELVNAQGQRLAGEAIPLPPPQAPSLRTGELLHEIRLAHRPVPPGPVPVGAGAGARPARSP